MSENTTDVQKQDTQPIPVPSRPLRVINIAEKQTATGIQWQWTIQSRIDPTNHHDVYEFVASGEGRSFTDCHRAIFLALDNHNMEMMRSRNGRR